MKPRPTLTSFETVMVPSELGWLRVQVAGTGPTIVFWPSLLMTGDMWRAQAVHFARDRRVVLVDPPGHGGSTALSDCFTFEQCARCVVAILDRLHVDRAHFVGNSWGGMIGATFAALYPDRLHRAVLMNCTASSAPPAQRIEYAVLHWATRALGRVRGPLLRPVVGAFLGPTTLRERPRVVRYVVHSVTSVNVASTAWAVRSVVPRRPDQRRLLAKVAAPVLVLAGSEDATFPVAETKAMSDAIPASRFEVLDGVAHLAALEDPNRINALIDGFLFGPR